MKYLYKELMCALAVLLLSGCSDALGEKIETETTSEATAESTSVNKKATLQPWQTAYLNYIENMESRQPEFSYSLIYLDNDDIPELFITTSCEAGGEIVVTYYNGITVSEQLSRIGTVYIERSGLMCTDTGHMGYYPLKITRLENGQFTCIASGLHTENVLITEGKEEPIIEDEYKWENKTVSREEYEKSIGAVFDRNRGIYPENKYSEEEIFAVLKNE